MRKKCEICKGTGIKYTLGDILLGIWLMPFTLGLSIIAVLHKSCNYCGGHGYYKE